MTHSAPQGMLGYVVCAYVCVPNVSRPSTMWLWVSLCLHDADLSSVFLSTCVTAEPDVLYDPPQITGFGDGNKYTNKQINK